MSDSSIIGAFIAFIAAYSVVAIALYVLLIIAQWKIFTKAGEAGWKSLIPFYNLYILFKISWKSMMFWIMLACWVVGSLVCCIDSDAAGVIGSLVACAGSVLVLIQEFKLSKAFGHGAGFFIGLLLLPNIFQLILGFGKSEYIGAQE